MIYIIKQEGLYQNKVNSSLFSTWNRKMVYSLVLDSEDLFLYFFNSRFLRSTCPVDRSVLMRNRVSVNRLVGANVFHVE